MQNGDVSSIYFCHCLINILSECIKDGRYESSVVAVRQSNEETKIKYLAEFFVDNNIILFIWTPRQSFCFW